MRDWEKTLPKLVDYIQGEEESENMFGVYVKDPKERKNIEYNLEEVSDKVISRMDESFVADFDFTDESLEAIDKVLDDGFKNSFESMEPEIMEDLVMDLGAYLGITIIENLGGEWRFRSDFLHSSVYFQTVNGECFPFHRVARRLLFGKQESLSEFYDSLLNVLGVLD